MLLTQQHCPPTRVEMLALHCLGAGLFILLIVILTGLLTWWTNYLARPMKPVKLIFGVSSLVFLISLITFTRRMFRPYILDTLIGPGFPYLVMVLPLAAVVIVIGWFGAQLTFPFERE